MTVLLVEAGLRFGFLNVNWEIEFEGGKIVPIPEFDDVRADVEKRLNVDGFLYPPVSSTQSKNLLDDSDAVIVPHSERPAFLYPVPPSHDIRLAGPQWESDPREGFGGFVLHLLAFLFRTRLQFAEWWFDGRLPIKHLGGVNPVRVGDAQWTGSYMSQACSVWRQWPKEVQMRFTTILYMFSRVPAYEWNWEEFLIEYMVLDACWKVAELLFGLKAKSHGKRIERMCEHFGLTATHTVIDIPAIIRFRNQLLHEALWLDGRPGSRDPTRLGYCPAGRLWIVNEQIIRGFLKLPP